MATEIERKFLVKGYSWKKEGVPIRITQAYLSTDPQRTVRVRRYGDKGFITIKGTGTQLMRPEFEYEIPLPDVLDMFKLAVAELIDKTRWIVHFGGKTWEVDEFHGANEGLIIAEIELQYEDEKFDQPTWVAEEVSGKIEYYNSFLSENPYKSWQ